MESLNGLCDVWAAARFLCMCAKCAHTSVKSVEVNVYFLCIGLRATFYSSKKKKRKWSSINPRSPPQHSHQAACVDVFPPTPTHAVTHSLPHSPSLCVFWILSCSAPLCAPISCVSVWSVYSSSECVCFVCFCQHACVSVRVDIEC